MTQNLTSSTITGLAPSTAYFFNVLVQDEAGNKSIYTSKYAMTQLSTNWTWVAGSNQPAQAGSYGTKGLASGTNQPGARFGGATWTDSNGKLWLFGGYGADSSGALGSLNDLWMWDGSNWTWMSGPTIRNQNGVYGIKGAADPANIPGARYLATAKMDSQGNLWLFGGEGYAATGSNSNYGWLNDLWKWDGSNWTWISGANSANQLSSGQKGVSSLNNAPGGRSGSVSWLDNSGTYWIFGGEGYAASSTPGQLADFWKFDGNSWIWVSGSSATVQVDSSGTRGQAGSYGTKGTPADNNFPGGRRNGVSWTDLQGNLWLFGGIGYAASERNLGFLNDLWKWDGNNWSWMSGSNVVDQSGSYGTKGLSSSSNLPGGKAHATAWVDSQGHLWLFGGSISGGQGYDSTNDLWRWDGTNWTWISGADTVNQISSYGNKNVEASSNILGARRISSSWVDLENKVWIFGGVRVISGNESYLNPPYS